MRSPSVSCFPFSEATGNPSPFHSPALTIDLPAKGMVAAKGMAVAKAEGNTMRLVCGFGALVKLAALCLLVGIALGFYLGTHSTPASTTSRVAPVKALRPSVGAALPVSGEEVSRWSRTSTSSCSAGF